MSRNQSLCFLSCFLFFLAMLFSLWVPLGGYDNFEHLSCFWRECSSALHSNHSIWMQLRVPRVLAGACIGFLAAIAGFLTQGFFRNPLAAPEILGGASGGTLGVVLLFYFLPTGLSLVTLSGVAALGVLLATLLLVLFGLKFSLKEERLLLVGFSCNILFGSFVALIFALSRADLVKQQRIMSWMFGSLSHLGWEYFYLLFSTLLFVFCLCWVSLKKLDVWDLGRETAHSLGVSVKSFQLQVLLIMSLAVGANCAAAGILPFLGVLAPYVGRGLIRDSSKLQLVFSVFFGATLVLLADILGRLFWYPTQVEAGVLLGLIAAPAFIFLVFRGNLYRV